MRRYETMLIVDPDIGVEKRNLLFEKTKGIIEKQEGKIVDFNEWGDRKLAYEIKKKVRGFYVLIDYCGVGGLVAELERNLRIDDSVIKFMTILLDDNTNLEKIAAQKAEAADRANKDITFSHPTTEKEIDEENINNDTNTEED